MLRRSVLILIVLVGASILPVLARDFNVYYTDYSYDEKFWDTHKIVKADGKIKEVGQMTGPVLILMGRPDGKEVMAFMPPFFYMNDLKMMLMPGQPIAVEGSQKTEKDGSIIIYVSRFTYKGKPYVIRDDKGTTAWKY